MGFGAVECDGHCIGWLIEANNIQSDLNIA